MARVLSEIRTSAMVDQHVGEEVHGQMRALFHALQSLANQCSAAAAGRPPDPPSYAEMAARLPDVSILEMLQRAGRANPTPTQEEATLTGSSGASTPGFVVVSS